MKFTIIALAGENNDGLFISIKEFSTENIILLAREKNLDHANAVKKDLERFNIPVRIKELKEDIWMSAFKEIADINSEHGDNNNLLLNVATDDCILGSALTSAAFVNGIKAFTVVENEIVFLPVLKFSYYKMLTDKKMEILKLLHDNEKCCSSLEMLSKNLKMSLPLVSYHINGTLKSDGLKKLGLVETIDHKGRIEVKLSTMGRLLVKGYIK